MCRLEGASELPVKDKERKAQGELSQVTGPACDRKKTAQVIVLPLFLEVSPETRISFTGLRA